MHYSNILYRCRDAEGVLLYVGIARDITQRMQNHKFTSKAWIDRVVAVETVTFPNYTEAHAAEIEAIANEGPLFNRNHNQAVVQRPHKPSAAALVAEIILGRPLADYVTEKRNAVPKWPWRLIAEQLATDTDGKVEVTHETIRQWYGTEVAA